MNAYILSTKRHTLDEAEALMSCIPCPATVQPAQTGQVVAFPTSTPPTSRQKTKLSSASALVSGASSAVFQSALLPNIAANATEGLGGFDSLSADTKHSVIVAILSAPEISKLAGSGRADWLRYLFALKDAEHRGVSAARDLALAWSRAAPNFKSEKDFQKDWDSADPTRQDAITLGTLFKTYKDAGYDLSLLLHPAGMKNSALAGQMSRGVTTVGTKSGWAAVPAVMNEATAMQTLNQLIGFARNFGCGPSYFMRHHDGTLQPIRRSELADVLAPYKVKVPDGNKTKNMSAFQYWTTSPRRYTVERVIYDPEGKLTLPGETIENTWTGFAIQPARGSWKRIKWHLLHVICGGKKSIWKFLLRWLAHAVQYPGTSPECMVVLHSDAQGTGKSTIGNIMVKIFGRHGHVANSTGEIFGDFNDAILEKSFILLEENAFPGDHKLANAVKAVITAPMLSVNPKGRRRYTIPNTLHMMTCTNEQWIIPAGAEVRRFLVLDIIEKKDRSYFNALYAEIEGGGVAAMLHDLLKIKLGSSNLRDVPKTRALMEQQILGAPNFYRWIIDCAYSGQIMPGEPTGGFGDEFTAVRLHGAYREWVKAQCAGHPIPGVVFGRELGKLGFISVRVGNLAGWRVPVDRSAVLGAAFRRAGIHKATP
jgi:hypothetical protein